MRAPLPLDFFSFPSRAWRAVTMPNPATRTSQSTSDDRSTRNTSSTRRASSSKLDAIVDELAQLKTQLSGMPNATERERVLQDDNYRVRRKAARLQERIDTLEDGSDVPEGHVVVKKEDADELTAFRAFKLKPAELKTALSDRETLAKEKAERENEETHADAADALGYANVAALSKELKRSKLHVELKPTRVDDPENPGKKKLVNVPFVRPADKPDAALEPLADYIEREIPELEVAFLTAPESADDEGADDDAQREPAAVAMRRMGGARSPAAATRADATGGVAFAAVRKATAPNSAERTERQVQDAIAAKRDSGAYSL